MSAHPLHILGGPLCGLRESVPLATSPAEMSNQAIRELLLAYRNAFESGDLSQVQGALENLSNRMQEIVSPGNWKVTPDPVDKGMEREFSRVFPEITKRTGAVQAESTKSFQAFLKADFRQTVSSLRQAAIYQEDARSLLDQHGLHVFARIIALHVSITRGGAALIETDLAELDKSMKGVEQSIEQLCGRGNPLIWYPNEYAAPLAAAIVALCLARARFLLDDLDMESHEGASALLKYLAVTSAEWLQTSLDAESRMKDVPPGIASMLHAISTFRTSSTTVANVIRVPGDPELLPCAALGVTLSVNFAVARGGYGLFYAWAKEIGDALHGLWEREESLDEDEIFALLLLSFLDLEKELVGAQDEKHINLAATAAKKALMDPSGKFQRSVTRVKSTETKDAMETFITAALVEIASLSGLKVVAIAFTRKDVEACTMAVREFKASLLQIREAMPVSHSLANVSPGADLGQRVNSIESLADGCLTLLRESLSPTPDLKQVSAASKAIMDAVTTAQTLPQILAEAVLGQALAGCYVKLARNEMQHRNWGEASRLFKMASDRYAASSPTWSEDPLDTLAALCGAWSLICEVEASGKQLGPKLTLAKLRQAKELLGQANSTMDVWSTGPAMVTTRMVYQTDISTLNVEIGRRTETASRKVRKARIYKLSAFVLLAAVVVLVASGNAWLLDPVLDALGKVALIVAAIATVLFVLWRYGFTDTPPIDRAPRKQSK